MAHVLLVDDDPDLAEALADVLGDEGHAVRLAHDGEEALKLLAEEKPDVILCDAQMPVLDGPGVARRILAHDAGGKIPFVLVSGVADLGRLARALGVPYYLGKPYGVKQLLGLIERVLAERAQ